MLFQHHINPEENYIYQIHHGYWDQLQVHLLNKNHSVFMRLGKEISLLGLDCRTERKLKQIVNPSTYNIILID